MIFIILQKNMGMMDALTTLGKAVLKSRPAGRSLRDEKGGRLIIMGNGPSLRDTIDQHSDLLRHTDTTAVNFAANTKEFFDLRPRHYILADPLFFKGEAGRRPANVESLWENLARVTWPMTLHIPAGVKPEGLPGIKIQRFNMTPGDGSGKFTRLLYRLCMAMPRPRNVFIPALMEGIRDGYGEIYIVGADHTWPHTLYVDDRNRVVTVQPHFYKEDSRELERIAEAYKGVRIHDVLASMATAFRSYHAVREYAESRGAAVFNATPGSLIDAFSRRGLPG